MLKGTPDEMLFGQLVITSSSILPKPLTDLSFHPHDEMKHLSMMTSTIFKMCHFPELAPLKISCL